MSTESAYFIFYTLIYVTLKGREDATDFINKIQGIDLDFPIHGPSETRSTSIPKVLINHTLGQNHSFVATLVVNNFEIKNKLKLSEF